MAAALVPTAVALGFGSLAQVVARRNRLLNAGWVALAVGVITALAAGAVG